VSAELPALLREIAATARRHPDREALVADGGSVGYAELDRRVDELAGRLLGAECRPGQLVGVVGHKSIEAVVAILAVLRAGAGYLPIDPRLPAARVAGILADAGCRLVLAGTAQDEQLLSRRPAGCQVRRPEQLPGPPARSLPDRIEPERIAYCMFTSGSTGRPKGVQVSHRAMAAFFAAVHPLLEVSAGDRCMNTSALNFDVSVVDLWYPLSRGATVLLTPLVPLPPLLVDLLEREDISCFAAVGSTLDLLCRYTDGLAGRRFPSLRRVMTGAEVLNPATVNAFLSAAPGARVINGFGPTEATCLVTAHVIDVPEPERTLPYPIGRPLAGVTVRFLAADGSLSEDGPGEILVAGAQLMSGYLNAPAATAAQLRPHDGIPFYHTGDLGYRGAHGLIEFAGRGDQQVKVRGYRVSLDEIGQALEGQPGVRRAFAAKVVDHRGQEALAAAVCADADPAPDERQWFATLADRLAAVLPPYMVPTRFLLLDELPTLASGKPDTAGIRRRLAEQPVSVRS